MSPDESNHLPNYKGSRIAKRFGSVTSAKHGTNSTISIRIVLERQSHAWRVSDSSQVFEAGLFSLVLGQWAASDTHTLQHVCHHSLEFAHLPVFFGLDLLHVGLVRRLQLAQQRVQGRDIRRRRETPLNFTPYKEIILTCHGTQTPHQR